MGIKRNMKKLAVQRDQYINPWDGLMHSRAATHPGPNRPYTAPEIRAHKLLAAQSEKEDKAYLKELRRTCRPVYGTPICKGAACSVYWVERRTPDRSIRRRNRKAAIAPAIVPASMIHATSENALAA